MRIAIIVVGINLALWSGLVEAYIGPGLGAGTIGVILGILASIFLALLAVVYYPIKRALKNRKAKRREKSIQLDSTEEANK